MNKTELNKCFNSGQEMRPKVDRNGYYGRCVNKTEKTETYTNTDGLPDESQRYEEKDTFLLLKKQNFFQAKFFSLSLYVSFFILLSGIGLQAISVYENNVIYSVLGTIAVLACLAIHFVVLYHISRFVKSNFVSSPSFTFAVWGLGVSMMVSVVCAYIYIFSHGAISKDLEIIIQLVAVCSVAGLFLSNILLYREMYYSVGGFFDELCDPLDYRNQEKFGKYSLFDKIILDKLSIPFRMPAHLFRIFSEAEIYSEEYGNA